MAGPLIPLGSGGVEAAGCAPKAALLDRAKRRGLPVPAGFVLPDGADWDYRVPAGYEQRVFAVRSAFSAEDGAGSARAGYFTSVLNVPGGDSGQMRDAVGRVLSSAERQPGSFRRDVLLLEMVPACHSGVAFTEQDYEDDLVNWTAGTAERLVSGAEPGESGVLTKLRWWERAERSAPEFLQRLQVLLRGVRRIFGGQDWDVEWADDGAKCWLVQLRPVTRRTLRNEAFTLANHREILPDPPSPFMTGILASCARRLFAYYRRFDATLPRERLFLEVFESRPLINVSLMCDMMRHWGLPTSLVTANIGGTTDRPAGMSLARMAASAPVLLRLGLAQLSASREASRLSRAARNRALRTPGTFTGAVDALRQSYVDLVWGMFALTAAMSGPLRVLRKAGVLAEWGATSTTITTAMYRRLEELRPLRGNREAFGKAWRSWLDEYGHRGVYESDVSRPRFREAAESLLAALDGPAPARQARRGLSLKARLLAPMWWQASRAMQAREQFRHDCMRAFSDLRTELLRLAKEAGIPEADLWLLSDVEATQLDQGWRPTPAFLADRRAEVARQSAIAMPDLLHRFDDLTAHRQSANGGVLRGLGLTAGEASGRAWVLREPSTQLPPGYEPHSTILVAPSVDAGWIPTFLLCAGVAVETGGDLSHGSIVLREIGLPAVTNVHGLLGRIRNGDRLRLKAGNGLLEHTGEWPAEECACAEAGTGVE